MNDNAYDIVWWFCWTSIVLTGVFVGGVFGYHIDGLFGGFHATLGIPLGWFVYCVLTIPECLYDVDPAG